MEKEQKRNNWSQSLKANILRYSHVRTSSVSLLCDCEFSASLLIISWQQPTTSLKFWRRGIVCCTRYAFCVITVSATRHFMTSFARQLSQSWHAAPAWSGACSAGDRAKLDAFVNRCRHLGYCSQNEPSLTELMDDAHDRMFRRIMYNREHVLQPFLPDRPILYNLRRRPHCNKSLITKTAYLSNNDYIIRAIYKDSYWHYS